MNDYIAIACSIIVVISCVLFSIFTIKERNLRRKELAKDIIGTLVVQDDEVYMMFTVQLDELEDGKMKTVYIKKQNTRE